jgi:hypothetical protein
MMKIEDGMSRKVEGRVPYEILLYSVRVLQGSRVTYYV